MRVAMGAGARSGSADAGGIGAERVDEERGRRKSRGGSKRMGNSASRSGRFASGLVRCCLLAWKGLGFFLLLPLGVGLFPASACALFMQTANQPAQLNT